MENLFSRSVNCPTPPATADQSNPLGATYINQADTEEELEEPPDILDIEMAIQSMNKTNHLA